MTRKLKLKVKSGDGISANRWRHHAIDATFRIESVSLDTRDIARVWKSKMQKDISTIHAMAIVFVLGDCL
jgi:hypothetical protein